MKNNHLDKFSIKIVPFLFILTYFFFQPVFPHSLLRTHGMSPPFRFIQQNYSLQGSVSDVSGPLAGVNILIKGKSQGTLSDLNGNYKLRVSPTDTLVFSYVGFKTLSIAVHGLKKLDVILQSEATQLQEVEVNAGYYTVKDKERTGSISKINGKEIELQPIVSPLEALQGRMAGVEVIQQNGIPGSAPIIRIRGQNSLRSEGNYPLYIIDGVPIISTPVTGGSNMFSNGIDPLSTLNLANIESIEVLKDADATAIYGSRGANGVVLITTKKGKGYNRKTELEAHLYSGLGTVSNTMDLVNTQQFISIRKAALENDGREPNEIADYDLLLWNQNSYTDWQEVLFGGTSTISDFNVSASGGNGTTSFRLGGSFHKEGTVFPGDNGYQKVTGGLQLNHISEDNRLNLDFTLNYGVDRIDAMANSSNMIGTAISLPPNAPPIYNEDGSLNWEDWTYSAWDNPLAAVLHRTSTDLGNSIIANLGLSIQLFKGLTFRTNMGYTNLQRDYEALLSKDQYSPEIRDGANHITVVTQRNRSSWILEPQLVYTKKIGQGTLDALLGSTFLQNENKNLNVSGTGFVTESLMGNLSAAKAITVDYNDQIKYKYNAIFARLGYNLEHKYFINLTGRRDGSSRFGPNKRYANFWAIGGSWIFSEEYFIKKNLPFLSFGKLRGSYGITGNDQIADYGYMDAYEATPGPNGLYPTQLTNPDYSWEENKKLEAAIELGFIEDRINLGLSWYRNRSSNQLVGFPLPTITGFSSVQANLPATVQNTGWEIELTSLNVNSKNFRWQTFFNLTIPNNKLLNFPNIDLTSYANTYRVGYPLNISLLYQYEGVDPETGLYRVMDVNEDGRYDYEDRTVIKNTGSKYFGGLNNILTYKGIEFKFLLQFVKQDGYMNYMGLPGQKNTQTADFYKAWQNGNNPNIQKASETYNAYIAQSLFFLSEQSLADASFIRLKTLGLSYVLPEVPLQKIGLRSCKLFLQGQNLITLSGYNGLNVEFPGGNNIPALRTVTLGAQFNF